MINFSEIHKKLQDNLTEIISIRYGRRKLGTYYDYLDPVLPTYIAIDYADNDTIYVIYHSASDEPGYYDAWAECPKWENPKRLYHVKAYDRVKMQADILRNLPKYLGIK